MERLESGTVRVQSVQQTAMEVVVKDKDEALEEKYKFRIIGEKKTQMTLQKMQKDFVGSINAYALVLVLLATVTYAGFLQPPGSVIDGYMQRKISVTVFIVLNSLSFFVAVSDLLLCVISSLSPLASISTSTGKEETAVPAMGARGGHLTLQSEQVITQNLSEFVASTLFKLIVVNVMFAVSLSCCVGSFVAAGFVVVGRDHQGNFLAVLVTSIVGVILFCLFMGWLMKDTVQFIRRALSDQSLSTSLQNRAGSLQVQFRYLIAD